MTRKTETVAHLDASIKRWKTRLKRAITMIDKLERKRKRMQGRAITETGVEFNIPLKGIKKPAKASNFDYLRKGLEKIDSPLVKPEKVVVFEPDQMAGFHPDQSIAERVKRGASTADLDIPEFLRRGQAAQAAANDVIAAEEIKAKAAETKAAKARGRIATMKAKKSGETKKMPLSGKAALDHIDNG